MTVVYAAEELEIHIGKSIFQKIEQYCSIRPECETGGIIVGYYSLDCCSAIISNVTEAPVDSKFRRSSFYRGIAGLAEYIEKLWKQGEYYLGEWHYHPENLPTPSEVDNRQMLSISRNKKFACPEPVLIIAGGRIGALNYSVSIYKDRHRIELMEKVVREEECSSYFPEII